ncbi:transferrin-binding protein-like solute binding protein [Ursidibacter sp. B-7004-1]
MAINLNIGFDGVYVEGQFYGPQASELGGIYYKRDKFSGTFGAKKQEKE